MVSLTFGLFTQVSGSGPLGPLVIGKNLLFSARRANMKGENLLFSARSSNLKKKKRIHSFLQGVPVLKEFALICKEDPS